jgi:hypothetical protein
LQQLQWPILKKELNRLDEIYYELDGLIDVNIFLPDRNFIEYNNIYNPNCKDKKKEHSLTGGCSLNEMDIDTLIKTINENLDTDINSQINSICKIKINSAFNKNMSEYNYRISKHSIILQNFCLKKIFCVSQKLEKIIQLNFYYVGIIFTNTNFVLQNDYTIADIDFSVLSPYNLHIHMWTGDKIM